MVDETNETVTSLKLLDRSDAELFAFAVEPDHPGIIKREYYSTSKKDWIILNDLKILVGWIHTMIPWKCNLYIFGTYGNIKVDFESGETTDLPSLPTQRKYFAVAAYNNFIYAIGGSEMGQDNCSYIPSRRIDR